MNRFILVFLGFILLAAGISTIVFVLMKDKQEQKIVNVSEKLKEGEEYLKHSNKLSKEKSLAIFSELSAKSITDENRFRIRYGLAASLEKNKDKLLALDIYKELNQYQNMTREQKEKLAFSLGNLLLNLNQEEEGKVHLNFVLQSSADRRLRSRSLSSIADFYLHKRDFEKANKNYLLSVQEDPGNVHARIGLSRSLRGQGRDWASYDVFDDYMEHASYLDNHKPDADKEYKSTVFGRAKQFFNKKQFYKAIQYFKKAERISKNIAEEEKILYYISESYFALGKFPESLKYIDRVMHNTVDGMNQAATYRKGTIYFRQAEYGKAAAVFSDVIDKYSETSYTKRARAWKKESLELLNEDALYRPEKEKPEEKKEIKEDSKKPVEEHSKDEDSEDDE